MLQKGFRIRCFSWIRFQYPDPRNKSVQKVLKKLFIGETKLMKNHGSGSGLSSDVGPGSGQYQTGSETMQV